MSPFPFYFAMVTLLPADPEAMSVGATFVLSGEWFSCPLKGR